MIHKEIPDAQRSTTIAPQLPEPSKTGRPRRDDRTTINGVLFALATGCRRADMPDKYGSKPAAHLRFRELRQKGIWKRILPRLIKSAHKQGRKERLTCKKFQLIHHQLLPKKGGNVTGYDGFRKIPGTKIHVAVDKTGLPISIRTSPANEHDSTKFIDVLEDISELGGGDLGCAIVSAYADKGYDAKYIRDCLRCHGISCRIPYKRNSKKIAQNRNQKHHGKTRFVVERFLAWPKCGFHRTAVGYEKNCENYLRLGHN